MRDTSHPEFSWSHSRDRVLAECARAYFWRYYGSHDGWRPDAPAAARLAFALKQLTTFPSIVGTAVHAAARDCALAVRQGAPRPSFDAMMAGVSDALNRAVLGSYHRAAFLRDPKRTAMLRDAWYSGRADTSGLPGAVAKARACLRALETSPVWEEMGRCRPESIIAPPGPEAFVHDGWPIYAGPDLVYRTDDGRVVIVDWKTGEDGDAAELQIPAYVLFCRTVLGLPFCDGAWFGRVANLGTGTDTVFEISRLDVMNTAERIRVSIEAMRALLADQEPQRPAADGGVPDRRPGAAPGVPVLRVLRALRGRDRTAGVPGRSARVRGAWRYRDAGGVWPVYGRTPQSAPGTMGP